MPASSNVNNGLSHRFFKNETYDGGFATAACMRRHPNSKKEQRPWREIALLNAARKAFERKCGRSVEQSVLHRHVKILATLQRPMPKLSATAQDTERALLGRPKRVPAITLDEPSFNSMGTKCIANCLLQGDLVEEVCLWLHLRFFDLQRKAEPYGHDPLSMAERLARPRCSRTLFVFAMRQAAGDFAPPEFFHAEAELVWGHPIIDVGRGKSDDGLYHAMFDSCHRFADRALSDETFLSMQKILSMIEYCFPKSFRPAGLLDARMYILFRFAHQVMLAKLLALLDQDFIVSRKRLCDLLIECAQFVDYPLDREQHYPIVESGCRSVIMAGS